MAVAAASAAVAASAAAAAAAAAAAVGIHQLGLGHREEHLLVEHLEGQAFLPVQGTCPHHYRCEQ